MKKEHKLPRSNSSESEELGIPHLLLAIKNEPLNDPLTLKLWPSLALYIDQHGGARFVRQAIIEKLQRIADRPSPAVCAKCVNLTKEHGEPFCTVLVAYLRRKYLREKWNCESFKEVEE